MATFSFNGVPGRIFSVIRVNNGSLLPLSQSFTMLCDKQLTSGVCVCHKLVCVESILVAKHFRINVRNLSRTLKTLREVFNIHKSDTLDTAAGSM